MTHEQMIKNKAKEYAYKNYEQGGDSDTWEDIYTDGAGYGYQLAVDKACEWLRTYLPSIYLTGMSSINEYQVVDMYVETFKKDMKGGDKLLYDKKGGDE